MQMLMPRVLFNLSKSTLQTQAKLALPVVSVKKRNNVQLQHYATSRPTQKLLRFPVFPLDETISKFLKTCEPLLTDEEMKQTQEEVTNFMRSDGVDLQKLLTKAAECDENWLAHRWLRFAYLQYRDPVTVFTSPGMAFPLQKFYQDADYFDYMGMVIYGLAKYKNNIDENKIPVAKMGKNELDNSQFEKVFGTCRIPKPQEDCLQFNPKSRHVVVIYKNHFYKMDIFDENHVPLHPKVTIGELKKIIESEKDVGMPFGVLTSANRDFWAEAYTALEKIPGNAESLKAIHECLFTVSLDESFKLKEGQELTQQIEQLIHGGGSLNGANRWMDKTIQLVFNRNGISGFCYEHSPAEGQPIALMVDYIEQNMPAEKKNDYQGAACDNFECTKKLPLKSNDCVDLFIRSQEHELKVLSHNLHMKVLHFKGYGKEFLKTQKLSPDSFVQIALQYAFYKMHKVPAAQYESAHLRIYAGGRTETIRSCSCESVAFAKAMVGEVKANMHEKVDLLRKAINGHREYTMMALQGRGVDRHLLGLKLMALENKLPVPKLYQTPGYVKSMQFRMSTSQVASLFPAFMGYGPSTSDGYSCCYNPRKNDILAAVGSWRKDTSTSSDTFVQILSDVFNEMHELLSKAGEKVQAKL